MGKIHDRQSEKPSCISSLPAVEWSQWFQNTGLQMLYKYGKFDYAGHMFQGVTSHQQYLNQNIDRPRSKCCKKEVLISMTN